MRPVEAWVDTADFRNGKLPPVCVHSGAPADEWLDVSAKSRIGAQWLLLLVGIVPMILVRALTIKRASGYLPVNKEATREMVRRDHEAASPKVKKAMTGTVILAVVAALAGATIGAVSLVSARSSFEDDAEMELAGGQETWDEVAQLLPVTEDNGATYTTWTLDSSGCIQGVTGFDTGDRTEVVCRPDEQAGIDGITFSLEHPFEATLLEDTIESLAPYPTEEGLRISPRSAGSYGTLNLAVPIVYAVFGALAGLLLGAVGVRMSRPKAVRLVPEVYLDRSGERLCIPRAHPGFAAVARPTAPGRPQPPMPPAPPKHGEPELTGS